MPVSNDEVCGATIDCHPTMYIYLLLISVINRIFHIWDFWVQYFQEENHTERTFGDCETKKKYSHVDLIHMIDGVDAERGSVTAGGRGYYLKV